MGSGRQSLKSSKERPGAESGQKFPRRAAAQIPRACREAAFPVIVSTLEKIKRPEN
jgi:hypothetical protein